MRRVFRWARARRLSRTQSVMGAVAILAVIMLVAAACGGDDTPTPAPSTPAPSTPTPAPATPTPAPSTPTPPPTTPDTPTPTPSTPTPPPPTPTPTPGDQLRGPDEWTLDNPATRAEIEAELEKFRGGEISISSYGGAYQAAQRAAWFEPFTQQFGVGFIEFTNSSNDLIKAQAETGNLLWDTVTTDFGGITLMCDQGLLEELDFSIIDNRHLIDVAINPCGSGPGDIAAHVLTYSLETYPDGSVQPTSWEDFFDVDRFPGRRFIRSDWTLNLWGALFADDPSILDTEESRAAAGSLTPAEVDRAFEIWEGFRDNLDGFWQSGSQCPQMLISGEADMCTAPNGRITDAQKKGAPLKICWECGFAYDAAGFAIPKGLAAQDPDQFYLTQLWMAWASFPENMIRFADYITYPPITALAPMLLADPRFDAVRDAMPLSAENIIYGVGADPAWVGEAYEEIQERWRTLQLSGG